MTLPLELRDENFPDGSEVLLWSSAVHDADGMSLQFWRMSFGPSFNDEEIQRTIREVLESLGGYSYVLYYTLGQFDLLLRAWMPKTTRTYDLHVRLEQGLLHQGLFRLEFMDVEEIDHWLHGESRTETPAPTPSAELARAVDTFNEAQINRQVVPRPAIIQQALRATTARLLKPMPLDARGVRFYSHFDHPYMAFSPVERQELFRAVVNECNAVLERWKVIAEDRGLLAPHISVYEGTGTFSSVIVLAKAPYGAFHEFLRDVIFSLRGLSWTVTHRVRPHTHVIADEQFAMFSDGLVASRRAQTTLDPQYLLRAAESTQLEFKATFALDLRGYLFSGTAKDIAGCKNAVLRAVCAMLNTDEGGTVVIGLAELTRELNALKSGKPSEADDRTRRLERFASLANLQPDELDRLEREGQQNLPLGNAIEWNEAAVYQSEDEWDRTLTKLLASKIEPNPTQWIRKETIEFENGRQVTALHCEPTKANWFYASLEKELPGQFFVRENGSTEAYSGIAAENYKRAHPRGDRP